jgi:hypothetical protein
MTQVKGGDNVEMFALQQTINDHPKMETICNLYLICKVESQQGVCNCPYPSRVRISRGKLVFIPYERVVR